MPERVSLWAPMSDLWPQLVNGLVWVFTLALVSLICKWILSIHTARRDLTLSSAIISRLDPSTAQRIVQEIQNDRQRDS